MGFDSKGLDDYIDVAQRIAEFRAKHPEGSLQPLNPAQPFEIRKVDGVDKSGRDFTATMVIYTAAAYRTPDDPRPGVGCAYEVFPGRTPYTAGSELQNAETAAWGRAIVAVLAADTRAGVASQQEVRNRQAERGQTAEDPWENAAPAPSRQNGQQAEGAWLAAAMTQAPKHATLDACTAMWRRSSALVKDGKLAKADASRLQGVLHKRMEELKAATGNAQSLDPDDPWAVAIEGLASPEDAEKMLEDLIDQRGRGKVDPERAARIERAIEARFPQGSSTEKVAA